MVCVCKSGKRKYQSLGISVKAEWWDFKANLPKGKCPNRERIILLINEKINEIQKTALDKRIAGKDFTVATLIGSISSKDSSHKTVGEYYLTYIQNLKQGYQKSIPRLLITDTQINSVAKAYIQDENFGGFGSDLSMWRFYNLLTGANKSSYIDSFLDIFGLRISDILH